MNKTPKINRLFLVTVIWILLSGIFMGFIPFVRNTADVFKSDSVYNACHRIYDHQQSESGKMDAV